MLTIAGGYLILKSITNDGMTEMICDRSKRKVASFLLWEKLLAEHGGGPHVDIHMRCNEVVKGQLVAIEASQEHVIVEQLQTQVWRYPKVTIRKSDIEKIVFEFSSSKLVEILQQEKNLLET